VGLIIGIALAAGSGRYGGRSLIGNHPISGWFFALSIGIIVSGLAGKYGDRLWVGRTSLEEPRVYNNQVSSLINSITIICGGLGAVIAFVINIQH